MKISNVILAPLTISWLCLPARDPLTLIAPKIGPRTVQAQNSSTLWGTVSVLGGAGRRSESRAAQNIGGPETMIWLQRPASTRVERGCSDLEVMQVALDAS